MAYWIDEDEQPMVQREVGCNTAVRSGETAIAADVVDKVLVTG